MSTNVFDATRFVFTFAAIPIKPTAEGSYFKLTKTTPTFSTKAGLNGDVSRSKSHDGRIKIELSLLDTDTTALLALRAVHETDINAPNGAGIAPLVISNMDTGEVWTMPEAWIVQHPNLDIKDTPQDRVIEFEASYMK